MFKRIAGVVLALLGLALLVGPIVLTLGRAVGPKVLYDLAYIVTLGLFLLIVGLYLLTRRAKAPEDHDRR
jgi:hypothetical protein